MRFKSISPEALRKVAVARARGIGFTFILLEGLESLRVERFIGKFLEAGPVTAFPPEDLVERGKLVLTAVRLSMNPGAAPRSWLFSFWS